MRVLRAVTLSLIAVAMLGVLSGCIVAVAGAVAGVAYVKGVAAKAYDYNMDDCKAAVNTVLGTLEISKTEESGDKFNYSMNGKTDEGTTSVEVKFKALTEKTTEVSVRFGVFGDKRKSFMFFEELEKYLK